MNKSLNFIYFLHISHWILLVVFLSFVFKFKFKYQEESEDYIKALNTIYTIGIGLVLLSLRFPFILDLRDKDSQIAASRLMLSAGVIVLSTLRPEDFTHIYKLFISN